MPVLTENDLQELERLYAASTPGAWKLWGASVLADQRGDSDAEHAVPVAFFRGRRTWDADLTCHMQRALPELVRVYREHLGLPPAPAAPQLWAVFAEDGSVLDQDEDQDELKRRAHALNDRGFTYTGPRLLREPGSGGS